MIYSGSGINAQLPKKTTKITALNSAQVCGEQGAKDMEKIQSRNTSSRRTSHTPLTPGSVGQLSAEEVGHFGGSAPTVPREGGG